MNFIYFIQTMTLIVMVIMLIQNMSNSKGSGTNRVVIDKENKKEMEELRRMRKNSLTLPLTEASRPQNFDEIVGQEEGIKALKAALCGGNPQHVIIYGPPGVGKTAAARLVLEYAKTKEKSPFKKDSKFVEIDATTLRFDERGIADPLIGSVHDPIYQGAGAYGVAGIPKPKPGAVTKANGGVLFIDEIGELHPIQMNKLLKVLEDRKANFDSSYYNSSDDNMPLYVKEVFENGLPADFRLIGATTRAPEEITPALRSRCVEVFFKGLSSEEIEEVARSSAKKANVILKDDAKEYMACFASSGREVINIVQLCAGIAEEEGRNTVTKDDVEWVIENGKYSPRFTVKIPKKPSVGRVNGLAVSGPSLGIMMEVEATATKTKKGLGSINITGIVEEEELKSQSKKVKRKSMARCSVENVLTVLENLFNIDTSEYNIHVNFPGGTPIDGPSAGITMTTVIYSAINNIKIDNKVAMTGEVSLYGKVKPIGGVKEKIKAAISAGAETVIIPKENYNEKFKEFTSIKVIPVKGIKEVLEIALIGIISKEESKKAVDKLPKMIYTTETIEVEGQKG